MMMKLEMMVVAAPVEKRGNTEANLSAQRLARTYLEENKRAWRGRNRVGAS